MYKTKRDKAVWTKDTERVLGFANYMDKFAEGVVELEKLPDHEEKIGGIVADMKSTNTKTSAIKNIRKVSPFQKATKKKRRVITAGARAIVDLGHTLGGDGLDHVVGHWARGWACGVRPPAGQGQGSDKQVRISDPDHRK